MNVPAIAPTFDGKRTIPDQQVTDIMLKALQLRPTDKVLEIGTGSGTQTQEFAKTGAEIHSIELEPYIELTKDLGGVTYLHHGDGAKGLPQEAPFTAIVASCGVEKIPPAWQQQLADKGRMIVPVGDSRCQRLAEFVKFDGELIPCRILAYVRFLMMQRPKDADVVVKPRYAQD